MIYTITPRLLYDMVHIGPHWDSKRHLLWAFAGVLQVILDRDGIVCNVVVAAHAHNSSKMEALITREHWEAAWRAYNEQEAAP
jgi:hypothetical protein